MKIAILGELSKPISLHATGGMEVFCALLALGLARRGNQVTLFATKATDNLPGVDIVSVAEKTLSQIEEDYNSSHEEKLTGRQMVSMSHGLFMRALLAVKARESEFDILHANPFPDFVSEVSDLFSLPIISTYHMPPPTTLRLPQLVAPIKNQFVAISDNQKEHLGFANYRVYNGIDIQGIPFDPVGGASLLWVGRIGKDAPKGLPNALQASNQTQKKLFVAGFITDELYYQEVIKPLESSYSEFVGVFTDPVKKFAALGQSRAFLYPLEWEEPFGLVFIEAMAAGTPVIAYARGSVPEIIKDGETGFIVNSSEADKRGDFIIKKTGLAGICEAIERIYDLSEEAYMTMRAQSRRHVEEHFTLDRMCENYEVIYKELLELKR